MMKNDLDFIREKIENSGVSAPADMDEAFVASTLENVCPKPTAVEELPKRRHKGLKIALSATAAALVLTITLGVVLHSMGGLGGKRSLKLPGGLALTQFMSYDQVENEVSRIRKKNDGGFFTDYLTDGLKYGADGGDAYVEDSEMPAEQFSAAADSFASGSSNGSAEGGSEKAVASAGEMIGSSHSETYEQVEGVSEADIIKTDGRYIYCVENSFGNEIVIFTANGADSERAAVINISDKKASTEDEADFNYEGYYNVGASVQELYLKDNRLIVLYSDWSDSCEHTGAQVYDISDIDQITLLDSMSQSGYYSSSRMIGDTLYTVSSYYPGDNRIIPCCGDGDEPGAVPADCIYSLADNESEEFLVVSAYDTLDPSAEVESKSIMGSVDDIYCNLSNMYIYSTVWDDSYYSAYYWSDWSGSGVSSRILKVDLTDGIAFTAYTEVEGRIDDQYALDEYEGNLRVATTSYEDGGDTNNLYVLDESMNQIGSVTGFAKDESIKAVRYLGDTAYVITYVQTDPLFVIDLSDPTAPEILGEVKISGFSTMLVPVGGDMLLGIGYHTEDESYTDLEVQEGLKLALFDVSDKTDPKVLDSQSYLYCDSEVQYNPKALVYNPDRDDFIIPLNYACWGHYDAEGSYVDDSEYYGGVLNFKIEDGKLVQIDRVSTDYDRVERCVYVGNNIYMTYYDGHGDLQIDSAPYK